MSLFKQKTAGRYTVHVYLVGAGRNGPLNARTYFYDDLELAKKFAHTCWKDPGCYKVKIWDKELGPIQPNRHDAPGLVYELV